jgi:signal transduction histidine kinase
MTAFQEEGHAARGFALDDPYSKISRLGLAGAIADNCAKFCFAADIDLPVDPLPEEIEVTILHAVSEAVANSAKHSGVDSVQIVGQLEAAELIVTISDDGHGGARAGGGKGLTGIIDRVTALGGNVQFTSPSGEGTRVVLRIPCV